MTRTGLSRPIQRAIEDGVLAPGHSVFDFGCGRGGDVKRLRNLGYGATGWDPAHNPHAPRVEADIVNIGYVLNVIEDPRERAQALRGAWQLARHAIIVAARPDWELRDLRSAQPRGDGWVTSSGSFQKFFGQDELRVWIESMLPSQAIAAAPGIFYVFRDDRDAQALRARQVRRPVLGAARPRASDALFEAHRELLDELVRFVETRGRLPEPAELHCGQELVSEFGSVKRAFLVVRRVTGNARWEAARSTSQRDLLVYLALAAFGGRPRMSELPDDLQRDVRSLFGSYRVATAQADQLLFAVGRQDEVDRAVREAPVGKVLPDAFYVHVSAVGSLPPVLRVYEGCAQVLLGVVQDATLVKLQRQERKVAYMAYPTFDRDPHPALQWSLRADLRSFDVRRRNFEDVENPPILHRKESFVSEDYPEREKFSRVTLQEERAGLLGRPTIGTRRGWEDALVEAGYALRGHRLVRRR